MSRSREVSPVTERSRPYRPENYTRSTELWTPSGNARILARFRVGRAGFFQPCPLEQFVLRDECSPLGHLGDRIGQSSPLGVCQDHERQRPCTRECQIRRCKTQRKLLSSFVAFVYPVKCASDGERTIRVKRTDMKVEDGDVNVVEQLAVILHGVTT